MVDLLVDGTMDFLGGQDASKIPDRIAENAYASGVNVSVKTGSLKPRYALERKTVTWDDTPIIGPPIRRLRRSQANVFEAGKFQGATAFYIGDTQYIIIIVSGFIWAFNPNTNAMVLISIADGSLINPRAARVNLTVAGQYLIIYDPPARPVIVEGFTARRSSSAANEVPVSTIGAFNQNRVFVGNAGSEFTGGDPVGNTATPNAPITFEEVMTSGSPYYGQLFRLPTTDHNDPITFMGFLQVSDVATGVGPLLVGTRRAIYTYGTQNPRSAWDQGQFGSMLCYNSGVVGQRAFANVNSDAFFLSADGYVRSLSMSRSEQQRWARIPISREAENWFKYWDKDLIKYSFISYFNNKIFISVNPFRMSAVDYESLFPIADYAYGGLVVIELDNLSSFGQAAAPTYAGLWTGCRPMEMVNVEDRAFIISKDGGANKIYEMNPELSFDSADKVLRPIRSRVYTREFDFKDPFMNKELHSVDFNFDSLQGDFKIDVKYKASHMAGFLPWGSFEHNVPWHLCSGVPFGCFITGFAPQHIRDFTLGFPADETCNVSTQELTKVFRKVQLQLTLSGKYWEIHEVRVKAMPRLQTPNAFTCDPYDVKPVCLQCNDDWLFDDFSECGDTL